MNVVGCPHCGESCRVPLELEANATVRCPWCGEESSGSDVAGKLPPLFEVVAAGGVGSEFAAFAGIGGGEASEGESSESDFSFADSDSERKSVSDYSVDSKTDRRRNPGWEFAKIMAGGTLALPIAVVILLSLPGEWRRDPLKIGPKLEPYLPWLRNETEDSSNQEDQAGKLPSVSLTDGKSASKKPQRFSQAKNPKRIGENQDSDQGKIFEFDLGHPKNSKKTPRGKNSNRSPGTIASDQSDDVFATQSVDAEVFSGRLDAAESAWNSWHSFRDDKQLEQVVRDQVRLELWMALNELGQATVYVNPNAPELPVLAERGTELLAKVASDATLLAWIGNQSAARITDSSQGESGIILFGTVSRFFTRGSLFETRIELAARDKARVPVLSLRNPSRIYRKGDRTLVLGAIIDHPELKIDGYQGKETRIVMGGLPFVLASE